MEAFARIQLRCGIGYKPEEIIENLKKERNLIFKLFTPSVEQIAYFLVSNARDYLGGPSI